MYAFSVQTSVKKGNRLELNDLPFAEGDRVEVVLLRLPLASKKGHYPLRGKAVRYDAPTEPVAEEDWNAPA
jgi:hypothetical protein